MTSLVNKLDSMTLNDNISRNDLFGYICRVKKAKAHFLCEGGFIVIPSFDGKKYILCKMEFGSERCFLCFDFENRTVYEYMNNVDNYSKSKNTVYM